MDTLPYPLLSVNGECSWKKTQIEKKKKDQTSTLVLQLPHIMKKKISDSEEYRCSIILF